MLIKYIQDNQEKLRAKKVGFLYTLNCPFCGNKAITIKNTQFCNCPNCHKQFGIKELQEPETKDRIKKLFDFFKSQNWSLVKIDRKKKEPVDEFNWQNTEHRDPTEWWEWIEQGYNIGLNLGLSKLKTIDFDSLDDYNKLKGKFNNTLTQKTKKGWHYIYKNFDIANCNLRTKGYCIEVRGEGQQIVIEPSETEGFKRYFLDLIFPAEISKEAKEFLLKKKNITTKEKVKYDNDTVPVGQRHYDLMSAGGHFKNLGFSPKQINNILNYVNYRYYTEPKPKEEINHICDSLYNYKLSEEEQAKEEIIEYLLKAHEASKAEIEIALFSRRVTGKEKKELDWLLVKLIQEQKIYKNGRTYFMAEDPGWKDYNGTDICPPIKFKMPYFYDCANFVIGDNILISAPTGTGKTHMSINFISRLVEQNIKPYILQTEPNKRFLKIAESIGLKKNSFIYNEKVINPETLKVIDNSVNIIDWLDPSDWTRTGKIFAQLSSQSRLHNAIMIIFMQLRSNMVQFAKDLVNSYPSFCVNFILEEDRIHGVLKIVKNNDPKYPYIREIPTIYNPKTKILNRADEVVTE